MRISISWKTSDVIDILILHHSSSISESIEGFEFGLEKVHQSAQPEWNRFGYLIRGFYGELIMISFTHVKVMKHEAFS